MTYARHGMEVKALLEKAEQLRARGDLSAARQELLRLAHRDASNAIFCRALANIAVQQGEVPDAIEYMREFVTFHPGDLVARLDLAKLLLHQHRWLDALEYLQPCVVDPSIGSSAQGLRVIALEHLGRGEEAIYAARAAYQHQPSPVQLERLASLEFRFGFPEDALVALERLRTQRPQDNRTLMQYCESLSRLGRIDDALSILSDTLATCPLDADLLMVYGQLLEDKGDRLSAESAYLKALTLRENWAFPLAGLIGLGRGQAAGKLIEVAENLLATDEVTEHDRANLSYELGKHFDLRGEHSRAWQYWTVANSARNRLFGNFDFSQLKARVARTLMRYDEVSPRLLERSSTDARPIFIVGMPRSGTTLTEQILASHPLVHGGGELPDLALIARHFGADISRVQYLPWPDNIALMTPQSQTLAIQRYCDGASKNAPEHAIRWVDKSPMNFHLLGLIQLLFSNARVIWCQRDPRDLAISIFAENFSVEERFATDIGSIGRLIELQQWLMRQWRERLRIPILDVVYEDLVTDAENQARRIIDFAGLEWDENCLRFHENARSVQTPSRWQVRQPMHTRSVGKWKYYPQATQILRDACPDLLSWEV